MGTDNQNSQDAQTTERTFTQAELDAIVKDRLDRANKKYADYDTLKEKATKFDEYEAQNKTELEKANEKVKSLTAKLESIENQQKLSEMRKKIATDNNLPMELLTGSTEDECNEQAEQLKKFMSSNGIPTSVSDGGEVITTGKTDTRTSFANWATQLL